jgi:hypothetical protein
MYPAMSVGVTVNMAWYLWWEEEEEEEEEKEEEEKNCSNCEYMK